VVWLSFDPQTGREQAGHRLALTVSSRRYNAKIGLAIFCPITSQMKGYPFEVAFPEGCSTSGVVLADQVKSLDWRARRAKLFEHAPPEVVAETLGKIRALLDG
jgi:mRNA interferase MazF